MLRRLTAIADYRQLSLLAPAFNRLGRKSVLAWRPARARTLRVEFADNDRCTRWETAGDSAQYSRRIVSVVQNHCDQSRPRPYIGGVEPGRVSGDPLDLRDTAFALHAFKIS